MKKIIFLSIMFFALFSLLGCQKRRERFERQQEAKLEEWIRQQEEINAQREAENILKEADDAFEENVSPKRPENPATDFKYTLTEDGNGVKIIKYLGTTKEVVIPSVIEDMPVTEIGRAFYEYGNTDLENVSYIFIPNTVTKIETFQEQRNLKEIVLSKNIMEIPSACFSGCWNLETIKFQHKDLKIGSRAFESTGLKTFKIPKGFVFVEDTVCDYGCFNSYVSNIDNINLLIEKFKGEKIHKETFRGCSKLQTVILPEGMEKIYFAMFYRCENLENINFPNSLKEMNMYAFYNCRSLKSVDIPGSVKKLSQSLFYGCGNLETISLHNGLETISPKALYETNLKELIMPNTVMSFDDLYQLNSIKNLEKIHFSDALEELNFIYSKIYYNAPPHYEYNLGKTKIKSINLPQSLKRIISYSNFPTFIEEIVVPEELTNVDFGNISFSNLTLTLKQQAALRKAGYAGKFE